MRTADFQFDLPPNLIAQAPAANRDESRLLIVHRGDGALEHRRFPDLLSQLRQGDVLVLNNSRVIPARLRGLNPTTQGHFEIFLLEEITTNEWWALLRPGRRARPGGRIVLLSQNQPVPIEAEVLAVNDAGHRRLKFHGVENIFDALDTLGEVPLPPYIERPCLAKSELDRERYQTVFADPAGSVAAPTAGLHFTAAVLEDIRARGVEVCFVTLHVGLGTFAPVKTETLAEHAMHEERYVVPESAARLINAAKSSARRVVAVGTTSVRVLESVAAANSGRIVSGAGRTRIFIHPPYTFRIVDALLTNFHLPRSTLLMLVSAFAAPGGMRGRELILSAYAAAIQERYRFFSYGDAMLLL